MPTGRKVCAPKPSGNPSKSAETRSTLRNGIGTLASATSTGVKAPILHQKCPMTPVFTTMGFEIFYLTYALSSLFLQYVNIYKTNYHLIDHREVLVIGLFLMRRIAWIIFKQVIYLKELSIRIVLMALVRGVGLVALVGAFFWLTWQLYKTTSFTNILLLFLYPSMTYLWVFGFTLELKLQRLTPKVTHQVNQHNVNGKVLSKDAEKKDETCTNGDVYSKMAVPHYCSLSPDIIRSEAESHRVDFNFKMKRALFQSFICAYYVGFIPMRFSKRFFVYYDLWWSCQHVIFVWISSLILLMKYLAPLQYCDTLSKCAVHLGGWEECDEEDEIPPNPRDWSALTSWPEDIVVNYKNKGLYKSIGTQNVADPGDTHHWRFYFVFQTPLRLTNWLLFALAVLIFYQLVLLCRCPLWHEVLSLSLLLAFNYVILFKLLRDRWVAMAMELKPT